MLGWLAYIAIVGGGVVAMLSVMWWLDDRAWRRALKEHNREVRRIADMNIERRRAGLMTIPGPGRLARWH